jgi:hypothetical protein
VWEASGLEAQQIDLSRSGQDGSSKKLDQAMLGKAGRSSTQQSVKTANRSC